MKFATIVGARPQFVKAAALSAALRKVHEEVLVHTGQHYDDNMSSVFFEELGIPLPGHFLHIGAGPHGAQTGAMLSGIEQLLGDIQPDAVIVFGDTNSTLAGALAAVKMGIPVVHVEAGLRSNNRSMPEEINRIVTDHISTWLFAPTRAAARCLASEGITAGVHVVGDIMADCVRHFSPLARARSTILAKLGLSPKQYALATVHRAANTDDPSRLDEILTALGALSSPVILPLHPRTAAAAKRAGLEHRLSGDCLRVIAPVGYFDMLQLMQEAQLVLTDSGGVQKEAYFVQVPCLTMRDETEWPETIQAGWNCLVGADRTKIVEHAEQRLARDDPRLHDPRLHDPRLHDSLYGDGATAQRITDILARTVHD